MIPWIAAHQAVLSFAIFQSLLRLMSIELVMPSNHLILCCPLLLLPSAFPRFSITSRKPRSLGPDENRGNFLLPGPRGRVCRGRRGREGEHSLGAAPRREAWCLRGGVWPEGEPTFQPSPLLLSSAALATATLGSLKFMVSNSGEMR